MVTFLFINNASTKGEISEASPLINPHAQAENEKKAKEVEGFSVLFYRKGGFFEQANNELEQRGYTFQMLLAIYSKDDIQVKYVLANQAASESVQEEVKAIFYDTVENNNL